MNILIYDDDTNDINTLQERIDSFFAKDSIKYQVKVCPNTAYLIENIYQFDMLFLDMEIHEENGIEIGQIVKKKHKKCHIIIISKYKEYLIDGYKIHADRYLIKSISQNVFNVEMRYILEEYLRDSASILDPKVSKQRILIKDILCIEYFEKHSYLKLSNHQNIKTPYSLQYWREYLELYYFAQPYKSYLVNCRYIVEVEKDQVILSDGNKIPLSRKFKKSFTDQWLESLQVDL